MEIKEKIKTKKNRSSIIRIIISNFDDKGIKELKVLYKKRSGVDVIRLGKTEETSDGSMKFYFDEAFNRFEEDSFAIDNEEEDPKFEIDLKEDDRVLRVKKTNPRNNELIKEYEITGKYEDVKSGRKKVSIHIKDLNTSKEESRANERQTERILLSGETIYNYSQLINSELDILDETMKIDSKEIYKINKFLSYRSNMIMYYSMIDSFFVDNGTEIWKKMSNKDNNKTNRQKFIEDSRLLLRDGIVDFVENNNNRVDIEDHEKIDIESILKYEEVEKILEIFSETRHNLAHFNYKFFSDLYSGEDFKLEDEKLLSEKLELNLFQELDKIFLLKKRDNKNYLDNTSKINVLGVTCNAKEILGLYTDLCDSKLGFNKFINSMFTISGEEDKDFKDELRKDMDENIERLKKIIADRKAKNAKRKDLEKVLEEARDFKSMGKVEGRRELDYPYEYDIHRSRLYKTIYNKRKEMVLKDSKNISGEGLSIGHLNKDIKDLNEKMKDITRANSKFRLEYKMKVAFGFLREEYDLDINKFKYDFNKDNQEQITEFATKRLTYLNSRLEKKDKERENLKKLIKDSKVKERISIFSREEKNNLYKLYVLMYLLLPREARGNFLGFVKKNYYDLKQVEFIERDEEEKKDEFFHKLRLFEKNTRKLELTNYGLLDTSKMKYIAGKDKDESSKNKDDGYLKKVLKNNLKKSGLSEKYIDDNILKDCEDVVLQDIIKYYEMIFKLINDVEIISIFKVGYKAEDKDKHDKNKNYFKAGIEEGIKANNFNFSKIFGKSIIEENPNVYIRNKIAHNEIEALYKNILEKNIINSNIEDIIGKSINNNILYYRKNKNSLDYLSRNHLNDYYKKKEQMMFRLEKSLGYESEKVDRNKEEDENGKICKSYGLYVEKDNEAGEKIDLDKLYEKKETVKKELDDKVAVIEERRGKGEFGKSFKDLTRSRDDLKKDVMILNRVWKSEIDKIAKKYVLEVLKEGEVKILNIEVYNKEKEQSEEKHIKVKKIGNNYEIMNSMESVDDEIKFEIRENILKVKYEKIDRQGEFNLRGKYMGKIKFIV